MAIPTVQRITNEVGVWGRRLFGATIQTGSDRNGATPEGFTDFEHREMLLDGSIYYASGTKPRGGLKGVLKMLGRPSTPEAEAKYRLYGNFNPVSQIVKFYENALGGSFGDDLVPETPRGKDLPQSTYDALENVWKASNLDTGLADITKRTANLGTLGLRACRRPGATPEENRVWIEWDDPSKLWDVEESGRGNVRYVDLRYTLYFKGEKKGDRESQATPVEIRETLDEEEFALWIDGKQVLTDEERENPYGFCPYVLMRHEAAKRDSFFGVHSYDGSEMAIHAINITLANTSRSVHEHVWPTLFGYGAGDKPMSITLGQYKMIYAKATKDAPPPDFRLLVAPLDFKGAADHVEQCVGFLRSRQPQMILNDQKLFANLSGETLQQALKAAESESLRTRRQYEDATVRVLDMGKSIGIYWGKYDLGTGAGFDGMEAAWDGGQGPAAFRFKKRPALPLTPAGRMADAMAKKAEIEAESAEARQQVLRDKPELVTTMVEGQAQAAGLAGEFAGGGKAA